MSFQLLISLSNSFNAKTTAGLLKESGGCMTHNYYQEMLSATLITSSIVIPIPQTFTVILSSLN